VVVVVSILENTKRKHAATSKQQQHGRKVQLFVIDFGKELYGGL
jgi:hypothetical protein